MIDPNNKCCVNNNAVVDNGGDGDDDNNNNNNTAGHLVCDLTGADYDAVYAIVSSRSDASVYTTGRDGKIRKYRIPEETAN